MLFPNCFSGCNSFSNKKNSYLNVYFVLVFGEFKLVKYSGHNCGHLLTILTIHRYNSGSSSGALALVTCNVIFIKYAFFFKIDTHHPTRKCEAFTSKIYIVFNIYNSDSVFYCIKNYVCNQIVLSHLLGIDDHLMLTFRFKRKP